MRELSSLHKRPLAPFAPSIVAESERYQGPNPPHFLIVRKAANQDLPQESMFSARMTDLGRDSSGFRPSNILEKL